MNQINQSTAGNLATFRGRVRWIFNQLVDAMRNFNRIKVAYLFLFWDLQVGSPGFEFGLMTQGERLLLQLACQ